MIQISNDDAWKMKAMAKLNNFLGATLLLSYKCNIMCEHCEYGCSPNRNVKLVDTDVRKILVGLTSLPSLRYIVLSGGEPFLQSGLLLSAVKTIQELGLPHPVVVTNGYWGNLVSDAYPLLSSLVKCGLRQLIFSADDFHVRDGSRVGRKAMFRAIELACSFSELDVMVDPIYRDAYAPDSSFTGDRRTFDLGESLRKKFGDRIRLEVFPVKFHGRAAKTLTSGKLKQPTFGVCPGIYGADPPDYLTSLDAPNEFIVTPEGYVWVCSGIIVGNALGRGLGEILERYIWSEHPITEALVNGGPAQLRRLLTRDELQLLAESWFVSPCHECYTVRRLLSKRMPELLGPPEYY